MVHMGHGRNRRSWRFPLVKFYKALLLRSESAPALGVNACDEQHVRTVHFEFKPVARVLLQYGRCEGAERLTMLNLEIEPGLHVRPAGIGENGTCAQRARPELHPALKPSERPAALDHINAGGQQLGFVEHTESR